MDGGKEGKKNRKFRKREGDKLTSLNNKKDGKQFDYMTSFLFQNLNMGQQGVVQSRGGISIEICIFHKAVDNI